MTSYYNENDLYAAQWLENLIDKGLIAKGDVDRRSIVDVQYDDIKGYNQCHFFAGIGGWSYALRLAGISDEEKIWTGSCPCQPFSNAGKMKGVQDERHLWPELFRLTSKRRPTVILGEQVASKAGREWLSELRNDMETLGYAVGAADLCAASVEAPHIRQRLYWIANSDGQGGERLVSSSNISSFRPRGWSSKEDLCSALRTPFERGNMWSQPLIRKGDDGVSGRMGRLRAYGNTIVPQLAAEFIRAAL